jgi:flagellar basal body-associated protein FliL
MKIPLESIQNERKKWYKNPKIWIFIIVLLLVLIIIILTAVLLFQKAKKSIIKKEHNDKIYSFIFQIKQHIFITLV